MGGEREMKPGDTVQYVRTGAIGWELSDHAAYAQLRRGGYYTVESVDLDHDCPSIKVKEDRIGFDIHPGHFEVVK